MPLADFEIAQLALEHKMITPFTERVNTPISYGLTSFGYDIQLANDFKFPKDGVLLDPLMHDEADWDTVQLEDFFYLPAGGFVLARSVETFKMPPDIVGTFLGRSTYARCFRGDTEVALVDGTSISLEDMAKRYDEGQRFWGYSLNEFGRIIVTMLENPRYIGRDVLLEIELDNGKSIRCTPDHEFITRDGLLVKAGDLRPNSRLMPLYTNLFRGYEGVYQPLTGHFLATHRLADEWNLRNGVYAEMQNSHRHHIDQDKRNNNPWNIERMDAQEHMTLHNQQYYGIDFDAVAHGLSVKAAYLILQQDPEFQRKIEANARKGGHDFWHSPEHAEARLKWAESSKTSWTAERREKRSQDATNFYATPANRLAVAKRSAAAWQNASEERKSQQRERARQINLRPEITEEAIRTAYQETGSVRGAARLLSCDRAVFRRFPDLLAEMRGQKSRYRNHTVVLIKELSGDHDVYCLTVPEAGNFALASGVFVKNCGLFVNVTPLEPGWTGILTLELSNLTNNDIKVYPGWGIGQVQFDRGERPMTTYAERKGKYMNQTGVTPARGG